MDSYTDCWEIEPVEVVGAQADQRPLRPFPSVEATVFAEVGVDPMAFTNWMKQNNLRVIVTRNQIASAIAATAAAATIQPGGVPGGVMS